MSDLTKTLKLSSSDCLKGRPAGSRVKYKIPGGCIEVTVPVGMLEGEYGYILIKDMQLQADKIMGGESRCIIVPEGVTTRFVSLGHDTQKLTTEDIERK